MPVNLTLPRMGGFAFWKPFHRRFAYEKSRARASDHLLNTHCVPSRDFLSARDDGGAIKRRQRARVWDTLWGRRLAAMHGKNRAVG